MVPFGFPLTASKDSTQKAYRTQLVLAGSAAADTSCAAVGKAWSLGGGCLRVNVLKETNGKPRDMALPQCHAQNEFRLLDSEAKDPRPTSPSPFPGPGARLRPAAEGCLLCAAQGRHFAAWA